MNWAQRFKWVFGIGFETCPSCGAKRGLKLSLSRGRVQCAGCGLEGPLLAYLREKAEAGDWGEEAFALQQVDSLRATVSEPWSYVLDVPAAQLHLDRGDLEAAEPLLTEADPSPPPKATFTVPAETSPPLTVSTR